MMVFYIAICVIASAVLIYLLFETLKLSDKFITFQRKVKKSMIRFASDVLWRINFQTFRIIMKLHHALERLIEEEKPKEGLYNGKTR